MIQGWALRQWQSGVKPLALHRGAGCGPVLILSILSIPVLGNGTNGTAKCGVASYAGGSSTPSRTVVCGPRLLRGGRGRRNGLPQLIPAYEATGFFARHPLHHPLLLRPALFHQRHRPHGNQGVNLPPTTWCLTSNPLSAIVTLALVAACGGVIGWFTLTPRPRSARLQQLS